MRTLKDRAVLPLAELDAHLEEQAIGRRTFCKTLGVGAGALAVLPACSSAGGYRYFGDGGVDLEAAPADGGTGAKDLSGVKNVDLSQSSPDLTQGGGGNCPGGITDSGTLPAAFKISTATYFGNDQLFICRDANGLYAVSSVCTHDGCDVGFVSAAKGFLCPCHGSTFAFTGARTGGVAPSALSNFALCLTGGGTVGYDPFTTVPANMRYKY